MVRFLGAIASILFLSSGCGGGGGSSSTPSNETSSSGNTTPTYNYTKYENLGPGVLDSELHLIDYREASSGGLWWSREFPDHRLTLRQDGTSLFESSSDYFCENCGDGVDFAYSINWVIDPEVVGAATPANAALDEYMYISYTTSELVDDQLNTYPFEFEAFGFYVDTGPQFLGTEYVTASLSSFEWRGRNNNTVSLFEDDRSLAGNYFAGVAGDPTQVGDLPSSGTVYYDATAIAYFVPTRTSGGGPAVARGDIYTLIAFETDGELVVDFSGGTLTGDIMFDALFDCWLSCSRRESTAGTIFLAGDKSSSSLSGSLEWGTQYGQGNFRGRFFGPNANEIGLVGGVFEADGVDTLNFAIVASRRN